MVNTVCPGQKLTQAQIFALLDAEFDRNPSQFLGPDKDPDKEYFAARDAEYAEWEGAQSQPR